MNERRMKEGGKNEKNAQNKKTTSITGSMKMGTT